MRADRQDRAENQPPRHPASSQQPAKDGFTLQTRSCSYVGLGVTAHTCRQRSQAQDWGVAAVQLAAAAAAATRRAADG